MEVRVSRHDVTHRVRATRLAKVRHKHLNKKYLWRKRRNKIKTKRPRKKPWKPKHRFNQLTTCSYKK